jgi:hypothetical protein
MEKAHTGSHEPTVALPGRRPLHGARGAGYAAGSRPSAGSPPSTRGA